MAKAEDKGIEIEFFASLREAVGHRHLRIPDAEVAAVTTVEDVRAWVAGHLSEVRDGELFAEGVRSAVNDEFADFEDSVKAGDCVAFMPAVTGG